LAPELSVVSVEAPGSEDLLAFTLALFDDGSCQQVSDALLPGRALRIAQDSADLTVGIRNNQLFVRSADSWEWLVGNIAVHRTISVQPNTVVLHAGAVAIGNHGLLLVGGKGTGKTTLTLALAARGHACLGDEMAPVRLDTLELVPLRRATSIRPGPRSIEVEAALRRADARPEKVRDGGTRVRAKIDTLFPHNTPVAVPLTTLVFLRSFQPAPRLEPFVAGREHLRRLTPLRSTLWGFSPVQRAMRLLGMLPKARCFWLDAGDPDATADLLEKAVHE
jgi:hypothetical protein